MEKNVILINGIKRGNRIYYPSHRCENTPLLKGKGLILFTFEGKRDSCTVTSVGYDGDMDILTVVSHNKKGFSIGDVNVLISAVYWPFEK
tara:strand:- start:7136 stop:7405 length:270 start_codon:yes stop_codon:yes gene_type:complete